MGLFMRPVPPASIMGQADNVRVNTYRSGGYRALSDLLVAGYLLLLIYAKIISLHDTRAQRIPGRHAAGQDSQNFENNWRNYYPELEGGLLGELRTVRRRTGPALGSIK